MLRRGVIDPREVRWAFIIGGEQHMTLEGSTETPWMTTAGRRESPSPA
jgi:hypothetical protein